MNVAPATGPATAQTGAPQFASLYVGDLDRDVTEAMLYEIFNTVGPVASIRVCRDSVSRRSLGYAYVNFHSAADAERVMDTLNYSSIKGKACRIMWSHRDPNLRKSGTGNVFVKNLDKNVDNKALYDTFSLFGNILSCKVATDFEGKSKGYGFVHYETHEGAKQAIERVNNMQIGEKQVYVGEFIPRDGRQPTEITNFTNVYVKNFPEDWDETKVNEVLSACGTITSTCVAKDKRGRVFAQVNFETAEMAKKAIDDFHSKDMRSADEQAKFPDGQPKDPNDKSIPADDHPEHLMYVQRAMTKAEREALLKAKFQKEQTNVPAGVNLYIKNLPDGTDDEELRTLFAEFGEITSAKVMADPKGRSKGFGFVCYKTPDEATKAVTEMHLKSIKGKPLYVGLAEKKDERVTRLAQRFKGEKGGKNGGLVTFDGKGQPMMQPGMPGKGMYQPGMMGQYPPGQGPPQMQQNPMMQQKGGPMMPGQSMMVNNQLMVNQARPMMVGQGRPPMIYGNPQAPMVNPQAMMQMKANPQLMQMKGGFPPQQMQQAKGMVGNPMQPMVRPQQPPRESTLTAQQLASAPAGMQKQMLGEKLYPAVSRLQPELAGKITGMMLEMENAELLRMLESETELRQKVDEAVRVLGQINK